MFIRMREKVFVGVSGGVDSSVALSRLVRLGYDVVAVFIKTWQPDFIVCNWEKERLDAMRVSAHLGVPFYTFDAENVYKEAVADYMVREYKEGRVPNPDVMCNQYVKFGAFLQFAEAHGVAKIATGHYARCIERDGRHELHRGIDKEKDQSYFLWTLTQEQLGRALFPIGDTIKQDVRHEAKEIGLSTSQKRDSQGICFLGLVDMKDFLSHYVETVCGDVLDEAGKKIGIHDGAVFYTIGQRHGFTIKPSVESTMPYYIVAKDMTQNTLTVSHTPHTCNQNGTIVLTNINLLVEKLPDSFEAQFRYRQKPFRVQCTFTTSGCGMLTVLDAHIDTPPLGQSCVFYEGTRCLGGGIINDIL